jgi:hypothetical protein
MYVKHLLAEFGLKTTITIAGDASAALNAAAKLSGGRMRHLRACDSSIKQLVKHKIVKLDKVGTKGNTGDMMTKHGPKEVIQALLANTGYRDRERTVSEINPKVEKLVCMNFVNDLRSADLIVQEYERSAKADAEAQRLKLISRERDKVAPSIQS